MLGREEGGRETGMSKERGGLDKTWMKRQRREGETKQGTFSAPLTSFNCAMAWSRSVRTIFFKGPFSRVSTIAEKLPSLVVRPESSSTLPSPVAN